MTKPTGRPRGRPPKSTTERIDAGYSNVFLGVGTSQDRSAQTRIGASRTLIAPELDSLYSNDGFARRIIDIYADEMVRAGFEVENIGDDDALEAVLEGLKIETKLADALRWSNLFGGSLLVLIVNDGGTLEDPLNENTVQSVEEIRVYDRHEVFRQTRYTDPNDKRFGKTETWNIAPANGMSYFVHASRCVELDGVSVTSRTREMNDGWGDSRLQSTYEQLVRMNMSHIWANALLERSQQAVHGIPELTNILRSPGGEAMVRSRIDLVDMARGVNNTVVIDALESYDLKSTPLSGVDALVDRLGLALCAVSGMPETLLFGRAPGGLSNSNKNDLENWYSKIKQEQETKLKPVIDFIVGLVLRGLGQYNEDYKIEFEPLWLPSEKDKADTDYLIAKTDEIYVNMGAVDASELRKMMGGRGYEIEELSLMPDIEIPQSAMIEAAKELENDIQKDIADPVKEAEAELFKARADAEKADNDRKEELHKKQIEMIENIMGNDND